MGLLDRYGTQSVMPEENTQNESSNSGFSETRETSDKLKPALEDKYEDVKNRIHALIIEQQLGAENADISDEGMKKLINEFVERNDFGIPRVDRDMVKKICSTILWATDLSSLLSTATLIPRLW